ncbi:protein of unknown function [Pseudobutyrivibrio sp. UC1225]|uniref:ArdC-like ssDNA-binding domain-containing protein n=1 Tax=Pseudobutyrivibrio sp. UC1225 TaxID=1798185 RepID=UPI0008E730D2|nr:ArdC-like ssDNA-binding domain-containing protein [Pseudobutyrivibrio sp. UC1225]SFO29544.1 protein of unknown function [Pseudobutyrivibrio sp. UC1225]
MAETDAKTKMNEITEKLEQGIRDLFDSEKYKTYLRTMSKFHNYSFNNTLLIAMQRPDASLVAGYEAWKKNFDRYVKKGSKGIKIISPVKVKIEVDDENSEKEGAKKTIEVTKFKVATVFDVSDTEGKELPTIGVNQLQGEVERFNQITKAIHEIAKVPIEYRDIEGGAKGFYSQKDNKIVVQHDMAQAQTLKTLIHELAHSILHGKPDKEKNEEMPSKDRRTKEVEAESVAYAVCQYFGIDTSDYSFGYIAGWSSNKELDELKSSMQLIRRTASSIISDLNTELAMGEVSKEVDAIKDESIATDAVEIEALADKKPSVLDQLKEKFLGKDKGIFSKKKDEPSI